MKNLLLHTLLLLFAIGCSSPDDQIKGPVMEDPGNNPPSVNNDPPLTFAVISDIHFGNDVRETPTVKVPRALKNITSYGELDALIVAGDVTDHGNVEEYQQLVQTFTDTTLFTYPVKDFCFVMGNHDNYNTNGKNNFQTGLSSFNNGEPYPLCDYKVIKGYPFIMVSTQNGCNNDLNNPADGTNAYPVQTIQWLDQNMKKASQECPGKPIFVITHVPPRWTCYSTWPELENGAGWCMKVLNSTLNKYPQAIVFAGHSHYPIGDPRSIHQGANPDSERNNYYTVINTGSTTYAEIHPDVVDGGIHQRRFDYVTEGLIVKELSNGDIEVRRYDTYHNEEIAADRPWVIKAPFDGSQFTYADIRNADDNPLNKNLYSGGSSPIFDENTKLALRGSANSIQVTFPQASDDDCVFRYVVTAYNAETGTVAGCAKIFSQFYLNSEMPEQFTHDFRDLESKTKYKVEVIAYDSYENASKPLIESITTR